MDDKELERLAQEELLQEAKRAQKRAEVMGPVGWQRCPLPTTNKRFLHNVLASTLEPREKKHRQTDTEQSPIRSKEKTSHREQDSKTTYKHEKKQKDRSKSQKYSSYKSGQTSKRRSDGSTRMHQSSKRRTRER